MKVKIKILIAAGAVAVLVGAYLALRTEEVAAPKIVEENVQKPVSEPEPTQTATTKSACDIFNNEIAKAVLGPSVQKTAAQPNPEASTDDVNVSVCLYDDGTASIDVLSAKVIVRAAKSKAGKDSNKSGFTNSRTLDLDGGHTVTSQELKNLGEGAHYNPLYGQANVIAQDGAYWLIIQVGATSTNDPLKTEQLAAFIVPKL